MYHGVIRHRHIYALNPQSVLIGDKKFYMCDTFLPPLFAYNDTKFDVCYFINSTGIFTLGKSCFHKIQQITNIYSLFYSNTYKKRFSSYADLFSSALDTLRLNKIQIDYIDFCDLKYNAKNIEYHTNLAKDAIVIFQALNSTLPYP